MANIAWGELSKNQYRIDKLFQKIDSYGTPQEEKFELVSGTPVALTIDLEEEVIVEWFAKLRKLGKSAGAPPLKPYTKLVDSKGKKYKLSDLQKTQEFGGGGFNAGNTGEGVFAAAIAARFISKTKLIQANDVMSIIRSLPQATTTKGTSVMTVLETNSPNANKNIIDKVITTIELAKKDMDALISPKAQFSDLLPAAIAFVNRFNVRKWADELYNNNVVNTIEVKSLGVSGATGTKVDTFVEIDGKRVDINISLKTKDIGQFGQQGGMQYRQYPERKGAQGKRKGQVELWNSFGIDIHNDKIEAEFDKHASVRDYPEAFQVSFDRAYKVYQDLNNSNPTLANENLARGIAYHATLNERNVEIVDLAFNKLTVYKFNNIVDKMKSMNIKSEKTTGAGLPIVKFFDEGGNIIFKIRAARSGKTGNPPEQYFRTYVEKGPGLKAIVGEEIKLDSMAV